MTCCNYCNGLYSSILSFNFWGVLLRGLNSSDNICVCVFKHSTYIHIVTVSQCVMFFLLLHSNEFLPICHSHKKLHINVAYVLISKSTKGAGQVNTFILQFNKIIIIKNLCLKSLSKHHSSWCWFLLLQFGKQGRVLVLFKKNGKWCFKPLMSLTRKM